MGKRGPKPLLADQGILHLKSSFVQPSEESGLLSTVGGQQDPQPLVLASGNYGYGIPHSIAQKVAENAQTKADEDVDPDVLMVREINGGVYSASELSKDRSLAEGIVNDEEMTVAELVRSIGGARDVPIRKCDVVEDRSEREQKKAAKEQAVASGDQPEKEEEDSQADEFYASLGIEKPRKDDDDENADDEDGTTDKDQPTDQNNEEQQLIEGSDQQQQQQQPPSNLTDGVRDFYKTYTQYYYSKDPNPYSDQRLEFGLPIAGVDENSNSNDGITGQHTIIQLARMAQIRARQAAAAADALDKAKKAKAISSAPLGPGEVVENEAEIYDPLPMEVVPSTVAEDLGITVDTTLDQYWEFVKDDPHDFNRWIYLIHYSESKNNIAICRKVYSAFLPLFSYCFGYWKRYSDMEKRFNYYGRALTILERGLEFIPLSVDLWISYIKLFREINLHDSDFKDLIRAQYERALNTCGMEFRSDALWEDFINFETDNKKLKRVFSLYGRILQVPTRLFNRHWDNFQVLVRDHHPRDFLQKDEYEYLRRKGSRKLGFKYKGEEPEYEQGEIIKPSKPEDKLMDYVKEKILKKIRKVHEKCEVEAEKRWVFEDRIRRPYFHTKPLDKYQLRNWEEYLNFEILEGDHDRIVLLFERCIISCALYESFWCKYARYLEEYQKKNSGSNAELSVHFLRNQENLEIGSKQETEEEEKRINDVQCTIDDIISQVEQQEELETAEITSVVKHIVNSVALDELKEQHVVFKLLTPVITQVIGSNANDLSKISDRFFELAQCYGEKVTSVGYIAATQELRGELVSPKLIGDGDTLLVSKPSIKSGEQELDFNENSSPGFTTLISVPEFPAAKYTWQEAVRDVYKRACIVHCPKKPAIRLQWAAFEEELGNSHQALELLKHVEVWFPKHLEAKLFILEVERRRENHAEVCNLYENYIRAAMKAKSEFSMFSLKYARFLHKELRKPDNALRILRNAIKKDKGNPRLYSYVFEICYEKYPDDKRAALAALELAIACKEFTEEQRLIFVKKKLLYLQEHGDIRKYRDTLQQMIEIQETVRKQETETMRRREEEQRLKIGTINPHLSRFPVPDWTAVNESHNNNNQQQIKPIDFEPVVDTIVDNPMNHHAEEEENKEDDDPGSFKKVAPPDELNLTNYGYASRHPDYKLAEYMAQKEYEKLESKGYSEDVKDKEGDKVSRKRKAEEEGPLYIIQPKSATMYNITSTVSANPSVPGAKGPEIIELEAPQRLSSVTVPSTSPCINVPDWFIKEGGELCLSETRAGFSVLRYWPHFLNDVGQQKMFKSVRRSVKWHQKQRVVWGQWRYVPRLLSWLGPCEWADRGLELKKNEDWPPEVLDLLHRINQITQHEFNSCFLNLYRTGHDSHPWHGDIHPAYGANPPVATISLGSLRLFEMKRRGPVHNFIRFPLFPGSLLIMEGACQVDWSHQIPKDPKVDGERISLVFRVMHAIEAIDKAKHEERQRDNEEEPEEMEIDEVIKNGEVDTTKPSSSNSSSSETLDKKSSKNSPVKDKVKDKIKDKTKTIDAKSKTDISGKMNGKKTSTTTESSEREKSPDVVVLDPPETSVTKIIFHNRK